MVKDIIGISTFSAITDIFKGLKFEREQIVKG